MTQEEKAKAYDIALDKIKRLLGTGSNCSREDLEHVFPELRESEDERIRKDIVTYLKSVIDNKGYRDEIIESWIAWLEKQDKTSPIPSSSSNIGKVDQNAWSEEDDYTLLDTIGILRSCGRCSTDRKLWLLSLKKRVQPQQKQEWSEEDENRINRLIAYFEDKESFTAEDDVVYANWLKSLRPQSKTYYWTENEIKFAISDYIRGVESYEKMVEKLRCLKPQSHWKPSKEQMAALEAMLTVSPQSSAITSVLMELHKQIKKLMEE